MNNRLRVTLASCLLGAATLVAMPLRAEGPAAKAEPVSLDTTELEWELSSAPGFPEGAMRKLLHRNPQNGTSAVLRRHPKGYIEPRHLHTTAAHGVYLLSGRVRIGELVAGPGHFFYAPAGHPHGPIEALENIEFLLWSDGPLDLQIVDDVSPEASPASAAPAGASD